MMARLLDLQGAAAYVSLSTAAVRALVRHGILTPVRVPSTRGKGASRRLLFDRDDLDRLIDTWKAQSTSTPHDGLSQAAIKGWRSSPVRRKKGAG